MPASDRPSVSIVVPTYNAGRDIERALSAVRAQTCPDWEVLIVDNHSSDDTEATVERFGDPRFRFFKTHNHGVIAKSRNLAIAEARGRFIAFLDADDWWAPQKLAVSLHHLGAGADVVYHDLFLVTRPGQRLLWRKARTRSLQSPVHADLLLNGNALTNSSVVLRKEVLTQVNGLSEDPRLIAMEDFDLWLRCAGITERFARIPETLGYYWAGGGNLSNPVRVLENLAAIEERHGDFLAAMEGRHNIYWLKYAAAKAHYRLAQYALARASCKSISLTGVPFRIRVRIGWMLMATRLFHHAPPASAH